MKNNKLLFAILLSASILIISCSSTGKSERQISDMQTAQAHMRIGIALLDNLEYGQALRELQRAYQVIKKDPLLLNSIGLAYKGLREYKSAEDFFKIALQIEPGYFDTHNNLGVLYAELGEYEKAKIHFIEVLKNQSYTTPELAHYNLALIFMRENKQELAVSELKKAIDKAPDFLHSYLQLGLLYRDAKRFRDSIEIFEKALSIQPDIPQFLYNIGLVHEMQNNSKIAADYFKRALENPECPEELARIIRQKMINLEGVDSILD